MELKYFRLIKTIAEEGSIANSSERLFLTQSALCHQLKDLEERLGFKVFNRSRNKWNLTDEGNELYKLANKLFTSIDHSFNSIKHIKEGSKGSITLSAECQSFLHSIPNFVQQMGILYPEINIDLNLDSRHPIISKLIANEVDVAIVTFKPISKELKSIKLFEDEIYAVMHKENKLNDLDFLDSNHFSDIHMLIHSYPLDSVSIYEHYLKPNNVTPNKVSAIPFTEVSLSMIESNMGVFCAPKWQLNSFKVSENIVFKRISKNGIKRNHYLVVKKVNINKKYIHNFISNFVEYFLK
ncbi:LysR family transcriptional regulator for metE and metH [Maribacter vaceletii]|uniref:LysR family transcriptional regulator for metE and metH n=1 Tax=Maribacter vaceletii TaxID=1206816 RepID=A0A495E825_9FLAO|nr:LysR family transcriptional regulator [Maribacter vaceletii]RKR13090.1 LysR family transcriptional regulator for metE and metH [Maribacter vaceletii]